VWNVSRGWGGEEWGVFFEWFCCGGRGGGSVSGVFWGGSFFVVCGVCGVWEKRHHIFVVGGIMVRDWCYQVMGCDFLGEEIIGGCQLLPGYDYALCLGRWGGRSVVGVVVWVRWGRCSGSVIRGWERLFQGE